MKEVERISLSGVLFTVDATAYSLLSNYLERISRSYRNTDSPNEKMANIEARLAEQLEMRLADDDVVVSASLMQEAIDAMGIPGGDVYDNTRTSRRSNEVTIGSVLIICLKILLGIIGATFIICGLSFIIGFLWLFFETGTLNFTNYLVLFGFNTITYKIALIMVFSFPFVGLGWLLFKLIDRRPIKRCFVWTALLGVIIWALSCGLVSKAILQFNLAGVDNIENDAIVDTNINTYSLHVQLAGGYEVAKIQPLVEEMLYRGEGAHREVCLMPRVYLIESSEVENIEIKVETSSYPIWKHEARTLSDTDEIKDQYTLDGSILTLHPTWYSNDKPVKLIEYRFYIYYPHGRRVEFSDVLQRYVR